MNVKNNFRAPLLLIAGELDRTVEASMNRANFKQYRNASAVTAFKEFPGRTHWLIAGPGWQEVADYALEWVEKQTARDQPLVRSEADARPESGSREG